MVLGRAPLVDGRKVAIRYSRKKLPFPAQLAAMKPMSG
jgi:hypothetical protein